MAKFESIVKESMEEASIAEDIVRKYARSVGCVSYYNKCIARVIITLHSELMHSVLFLSERVKDGYSPKSSELIS